MKWDSPKSTITVSPIDSFLQLPLQTKNPKKESKQAIMAAAPCEACNTIPRAVSEGYVEKGQWIEIAGLPTCTYQLAVFNHHHHYLQPHNLKITRNPLTFPPDVTGPETATKGIVDVYDVFGPASQTLQGADGLATALGAIVLVPDFFKGEKALDEWFTNVTPENDALKNAFFGKVMGGGLGGSVQALKDVVEEAKIKWSGVESWGTFGLCWGGKVG
jgi:hypothetical protein